MSIENKLRVWLGDPGIEFFTKIYKEFGKVSVVLPINHPLGDSPYMPHAVHFREGMQVRNFLRSLPECKNWDDLNFDDRWEDYVIMVITEKNL